MITKTCNVCKETKDGSFFSKNKTMFDGLQSQCKACVKTYNVANKEKKASRKKAYYEANKDKTKAYCEANKDKINAYYQSPLGKYKSYKAGAKKRGLSFNLTMDEFMTFWQANCTYCGDQVPTIGIDRVDSNLGYTVENCVPCCKMCNIIKLDHDNDILNTHLLKMLKHQGIV